MPHRTLTSIIFTALLFLPQGALAQASATWQFRNTRCERRFELLEYPLFDPFGYRYTAPINLPGIGPRHRIVECAYLGPGGAGGKFVIGGFDGGDGDWDGRIDFSGYIDDLLREREERRGRDGDGDRDGDRDDVPDYLDADRAQPLMPQTGVDLY